MQLDETAFPIILAQQVGDSRPRRSTPTTSPRPPTTSSPHGPTTPQERWEETGGYSPVHHRRHDRRADRGRRPSPTKVGDARRRRHLPGHRRPGSAASRTGPTPRTATSRTASTTSGSAAAANPNDGATRNWANGAGAHPENAITDAGFLELTRLGVKAPDDPYVAHSLLAASTSRSRCHPERRHFEALHLRRLRRDRRRAPVDRRRDRPPWPLLVRRTRRVRARPTAATPCPTCAPWPTPPTPDT